jgi:hypothetical protein
MLIGRGDDDSRNDGHSDTGARESGGDGVE